MITLISFNFLSRSNGSINLHNPLAKIWNKFLIAIYNGVYLQNDNVKLTCHNLDGRLGAETENVKLQNALPV